MKRLLLFSALVLVASAATSRAQDVPRRVLFEEFTNTGCPPCAVSDPIVEEFETGAQAEITTLKWHPSGPDPSDPFYINNKIYFGAPGINNRANYYSVTGVPYVRFSGMHGDFAT